MHELTNAIIKNKKLDKPYEKVAVIEIIFEFIEKMIDDYIVSNQRELSRGKILRMIRLMDLNDLCKIMLSDTLD